MPYNVTRSNTEGSGVLGWAFFFLFIFCVPPLLPLSSYSFLRLSHYLSFNPQGSLFLLLLFSPPVPLGGGETERAAGWCLAADCG